MVEIQCPHCVEIIELEDGLSGTFDCPYCNNEFIWGDNKKTKQISNQHISHYEPMPLGFKIGFGIIVGLILLVIFGYLFLLILFDGLWG